MYITSIQFGEHHILILNRNSCVFLGVAADFKSEASSRSVFNHFLNKCTKLIKSVIRIYL